MKKIKKIVLHGLAVNSNIEKHLIQIIDHLKKENVDIKYTSLFFERNKKIINDPSNTIDTASSDLDIVFSLGGDGTFLESLLWVGETEVPILGVNMGRLGFLASIAKEHIKESLYLLFEGKYEIESRSLLTLETDMDIFEGKKYALNECAILRKDTSSMIKIKCYINEQYLNTYWADGLMVSTPTGSTGYSLSCGGPLVMPNSKDFIITPVSPHNLNVRPLIVSDNSKIKLQIQARNRNFLISLDSRSESIENNVDIVVKKASFQSKLIQIDGINFSSTIKNKLGWGFDKRN